MLGILEYLRIYLRKRGQKIYIKLLLDLDVEIKRFVDFGMNRRQIQ